VSIDRTLDVWSSIFGPAPFCEFDFVGLMVFVKEEKLKYICKFGKELFKKSHALFWIVFGLYIKYLTVKDLTETLNLLIGLFSIDIIFVVQFRFVLTFSFSKYLIAVTFF
jgi:hypothetical protein